uniref:SFRICE_035211 n=1 Tax=Spodoptera frugiperda TaxID=7108 RepID=A0A2H1V8U0_SPOFR
MSTVFLWNKPVNDGLPDGKQSRILVGDSGIGKTGKGGLSGGMHLFVIMMTLLLLQESNTGFILER